MSKTADLRALIMAQLGTITGGTYHKNATVDAAYPYKVFSLSRANLSDLSRDDIDLCIDIWDNSTDSKRTESIADDIEVLFNASNLPQTSILPTFFRDSRYPVDDPDKTIQHIQMHITVQMYEMEE